MKVTNKESEDPLVVQHLSDRRIPSEGREEIVEDFSYNFHAATFYALSGPEFGGKSLLLHLLGLLAKPASGQVLMEGQPVTGLDLEELSEIRNRKFGFLFPAPFLLPSFNVLENVAMPLFKITQASAREAKAATEAVLELVGISEIADVAVDQLRPVEQHLVALARAVIHHPKILIGENIGARLEDRVGEHLLSKMRQVCQRLGITVIATIAPGFKWERADVVLEVEHPRIEEVFNRIPHG
jgi:lipoprotein-releasing system ATP-binding protein